MALVVGGPSGASYVKLKLVGSGGDARGDTISGFENIIGSANDDELKGSLADGTSADGNRIEGLAGADTLHGGDEDTDGDQNLAFLVALQSSSDAETNATNDRSDTLSYSSSSAGVTVNLVTSTASGGDADGDVIETFEVDDYDHDGDSVVDNDENTLTGENGGVDEDSDTERVDVEFSTFENIMGSAHNDSLTGDDRENTIWGGAGDDTLRGWRQ